MMKNFVWGFIVFLCSVSFAEKPVIFWASDPVKPNQTILVQGDLLDGDTELQIAMLPNEQTNTPELDTVDLDKIKFTSIRSMQPSLQTGKYVIPAGWELGIYAIRPIRGGETGKVTLVNAPQAWWIQGNQVDYSTPDSQFSVYGKCLSYGDAKVYLKDRTGKCSEIPILEQDMWHISVDLKKMPVGDYEVFLHNGLGGRFGWIQAGTLTIKEKTDWPQKVFNVVDYGAKPNFDPNRSRLDQTDDSPAFQKALDAAGANGGGVVFIPKGCYRLVKELKVPRFVTIRGESMLATNLGWTDKEEPPLGLINGTNNFAVENLTIFVQNYWSVIRGDHGHTKDSGNIAVRRVTIRANRNLGIMNREYPDKWKDMQIERRWNVKRREAALFFGGENIEITDCDVLVSHNSIILDKASGLVANNIFHCPQTFQNDQYWIRGCHDLIFTNNDIYGGGCLGTHNTTRGMNKQKDWECYFNGVSRNIYFANNKQHDNWKWDREMMTLDSHGYGGPYLGPVAAAKGNTVTFPDAFPVLRADGEIFSKSGAVLSQKKLSNTNYYKIVAKLVSKKEKLDWDRCFVNFYDIDQVIDSKEPEQFDRNGDSRHYAHGKVNAVRVRGSKDFEVKEFRIAKSWDELLDPSNEPFLSDIKLNGNDKPKKSAGVIFDFDADGVLYVSVIVKTTGAYCTGQVELLMENGKRALDLGISRLGGTNVDFNKIPKSPNQHSGNINLYKGAFVYVLEGKGCGQYRRIVDGKGNTLVVDRPWDVELDGTSVISVHRTHDHQIFVNNDYSDGGMALQMYGGAVETVIADNTATRAGGFLVTGLQACVPMYCQLLNNTVVTGAGLGGPPFNLRGGRISVEPYRPVGYHNGYQSIGIVMRGNRFENMASANVAGPVQNVLIEDNYFANTEAAIMIHSEGMGSFLKSWYWPQDVFIRNNTVENVDTLLKADKEASVKVCE